MNDYATHRNGCSGPYCGFTGHRHHSCSSDCSELKKRKEALYGIDRLIEAKKEDLRNLTGPMTEARIRLREEVAEQIKALKDMKVMGEYYGLDLSRPA